MSTIDGGARISRWTPPPRPDWVSRVNAVGDALDLRHVVPLDEQSLIDAATAATGLSDFGDDGWREAFSVLCKALEDEARLNLLGRVMTRTDILLALQARLQIEETYSRHPEIEDEQITAPLMIIGQGRSGTTALQNLLAEDPRNETMRSWEVLFPCPPPEAATYRTDPRIAAADAVLKVWNDSVPEVASMHEFTAWAPTEDVHTQCLSFRMPAWIDPIWGQVPSFGQYCFGQDLAEAYRYEKRVLKLLQWRNPRERWILKSPFALTHLPVVTQVFPDVGFIWTHRDPLKAVSSMVSLVGTLNWLRTDHPHQGDTLAMLTNSDLAAGLMSQPIGWLKDGLLRPESLCNVQYSDFVRDPLGTVGSIYEFFGMTFTAEARAAMQTFMDENPRSGRPGHAYDVGTAQEIALERPAFAGYQAYFGVPNEI